MLSSLLWLLPFGVVMAFLAVGVSRGQFKPEVLWQVPGILAIGVVGLVWVMPWLDSIHPALALCMPAALFGYLLLRTTGRKRTKVGS